jgi:excisionase family DNA binding protein
MEQESTSYMTLETAAHRASLSTKTLRRAITAGRLIAFIPAGVKAIRIREQDLESFMMNERLTADDYDQLLRDIWAGV